MCTSVYIPNSLSNEADKSLDHHKTPWSCLLGATNMAMKTCYSSVYSERSGSGRHAGGYSLNLGQATLDEALVHNVQCLLVQPLPGSLIPCIGVAGLAHGCVVEVERQQPQPWRAEVRAAIPCTIVHTSTLESPWGQHCGLILGCMVRIQHQQPQPRRDEYRLP